MRDSRAHKRISFDALGFLQMGDVRIGVQTVNVSKNGACLSVGEGSWAGLEDLDLVVGRLNLGGQDFNFTGRICWSMFEIDKVVFGIEFVDADRPVMMAMLESMSILEDEPPTDSFNL